MQPAFPVLLLLLLGAPALAQQEGIRVRMLAFDASVPDRPRQQVEIANVGGGIISGVRVQCTFHDNGTLLAFGSALVFGSIGPHETRTVVVQPVVASRATSARC